MRPLGRDLFSVCPGDLRDAASTRCCRNPFLFEMAIRLQLRSVGKRYICLEAFRWEVLFRRFNSDISVRTSSSSNHQTTTAVGTVPLPYYSKETLFSLIASPGVPHNPVVSSILTSAISYETS